MSHPAAVQSKTYPVEALWDAIEHEPNLKQMSAQDKKKLCSQYTATVSEQQEELNFDLQKKGPIINLKIKNETFQLSEILYDEKEENPIQNPMDLQEKLRQKIPTLRNQESVLKKIMLFSRAYHQGMLNGMTPITSTEQHHFIAPKTKEIQIVIEDENITIICDTKNYKSQYPDSPQNNQLLDGGVSLFYKLEKDEKKFVPYEIATDAKWAQEILDPHDLKIKKIHTIKNIIDREKMATKKKEMLDFFKKMNPSIDHLKMMENFNLLTSGNNNTSEFWTVFLHVVERQNFIKPFEDFLSIVPLIITKRDNPNEKTNMTMLLEIFQKPAEDLELTFLSNMFEIYKHDPATAELIMSNYRDLQNNEEKENQNHEQKENEKPKKIKKEIIFAHADFAARNIRDLITDGKPTADSSGAAAINRVMDDCYKNYDRRGSEHFKFIVNETKSLVWKDIVVFFYKIWDAITSPSRPPRPRL